MSLYVDRYTRVVPPRNGGGGTVGQGIVRTYAATNSSTPVELDTDIFSSLGVANAAAVPGAFGRAILSISAEGADVWVNFGSTSAFIANSAATSTPGATSANACWHIPNGQEREYEVDPLVDKWFCANTQNGQAGTATVRYRISSFQLQGGNPGPG
ncbi:MAG: hypothetical protein WBY94_20305 [Polyangiaceae bacterium]